MFHWMTIEVILNRIYEKNEISTDITKSEIKELLNLLIRDSSNNINTTLYQKRTSNDICLNWESFAPGKWKQRTLKTLTKRAYDVCSNQELLQKELNYIEKVFRANNDYPNWVIKKLLQEVKQQEQQQ